MEIKLISTNAGINLLDAKYEGLSQHEKIREIVQELSMFAGKLGGECYSSDSLEHIMNESEKETRGRMNFCLNKKHHSIFEHPKLTFEFVGVPKFIFMMLNNQYVYTTSERSARYTNFSELIETKEESERYVKWTDKISQAIKDVYGDKFTEKEVQKLAQENARYMISVFVPSSMVHTISLKDLNYTLYLLEEFLESYWERKTAVTELFMSILRPKLEEFLKEMEPYKLAGLEPKFVREIAIFKTPLNKENQADATYRLNYEMSFAAFAQAQRHRSIRYSIELKQPTPYIPPIIRTAGLEEEWVGDMLSICTRFPQGLMVDVTETGEIEDFVGKCYERCCGRAQLEIQENTCNSLAYLRTSENAEVVKYLKETTGDSFARCGFPGYQCVEVCKFGKNQRERKI